MKKKHYRDYATDAFRILALYGSSEKYKERIIRECREASSDLGTKIDHGVSSPTEAEVIRAQDALDNKMSTIADLEAAERALEIVIARHGDDAVKAVKICYMMDPHKPLAWKEIQTSVIFAVMNLHMSERTVYRYLALARKSFAIERGLRVE